MINQDIFTPPSRGMIWPACRHVIFDCDSTLARIEGIDVLAEKPRHQSRVANLTEAAMDGRVALEEVYEKRLDMLTPSRAQVDDLSAAYLRNVVDDTQTVVSELLSADVNVYVVSGGLLEPVRKFARGLGIPEANVRAVPIKYDELSGSWWRRDAHAHDRSSERFYRVEPSELTASDGKARVIDELLEGQPGRRALVGDGVSDLEAKSSVDLFIGFGGVVHRSAVAEGADVFIRSASLLPVLPLVLGSDRFQRLGTQLTEKVRRHCRPESMTFRRASMAARFQQSIC